MRSLYLRRPKRTAAPPSRLSAGGLVGQAQSEKRRAVRRDHPVLCAAAKVQFAEDGHCSRFHTAPSGPQQVRSRPPEPALYSTAGGTRPR